MDPAYVIPPSGGTPWTVGGDVVVCKADLQLVEAHIQVFVTDGRRGASLELHRHAWDEIVIVVDGVLELHTVDDVHVLVSGAVGVAPAGADHGFRTVSETSRFLTITSSDRAAGAFAELHHAAVTGADERGRR